MNEHLDRALVREYEKINVHDLVNRFVAESRKRNLMDDFTAMDEALFRQAIALDLVEKYEPELERSVARQELLAYLKNGIKRFSEAPNSRRALSYASDVVVAYYKTEPTLSREHRTIRAVESLKA